MCWSSIIPTTRASGSRLSSSSAAASWAMQSWGTPRSCPADPCTVRITAPTWHLVLGRLKFAVHRRGRGRGSTVGKHENVAADGTLIATDRCRTKNPDTGHDLWFSGKHRAHGGNVQVVCDPDGFPAAVSDVEPGRRSQARHYVLVDLLA